MNQIAPSAIRAGTHPAWRVALPAVVLALVVILLLFHETALGMASIWARSDTYAHGFIVPPITLWLIWRLRSDLAVMAPGHSFVAVIPLVGVGFAWLLGELAVVNVVPQFALVAMVVLTVPAVLGWTVARRITFPLLFLFFAVPFGDFAYPKLMEWTAHFTILGLRLSGIPVHSEGLFFVIPTGSWSVVEACSGVRYLIASVTVGSLFAYLTYRSWKRRLTFVVVSFAVPIVANWFRAYMIVMIGHLSGNKLAVGVDHLIYGWVFFGIVILAMFWIGGRWREDELPVAARAAAAVPAAALPATSRSLVAAMAVVLVGGIWPFAQYRIEHDLAPPLERIAPLGPIAGWQPAVPVPGLDDWRPRFENFAASTQLTFENRGRVAGVFLAYYRNQDQQHKLVSSTNVVVASDDRDWLRVGSGVREIVFDQQPIKLRTAELRGTDGTRMVVWQSYWVDGRWTSSDALAKVYTALSRLVGKGDDSAVVILYAPSDKASAGEAALEDFVRSAGPVIDSALRQTMEDR